MEDKKLDDVLKTKRLTSPIPTNNWYRVVDDLAHAEQEKTDQLFAEAKKQLKTENK
jgi:hypothetical protein